MKYRIKKILKEILIYILIAIPISIFLLIGLAVWLGRQPPMNPLPLPTLELDEDILERLREELERLERLREEQEEIRATTYFKNPITFTHQQQTNMNEINLDDPGISIWVFVLLFSIFLSGIWLIYIVIKGYLVWKRKQKLKWII